MNAVVDYVVCFLSSREKDLTAKCIIKMEGTKTSIVNLKVRMSAMLISGLIFFFLSVMCHGLGSDSYCHIYICHIVL